jgi:hypothetical protein
MEFLSIIWGLKTTAIFDVWTIEHLFSGISIGCAVRIRHHKEFKKFVGEDHKCHSWHFDMMGVLFLAYIWETIEHYLESGLAGSVVEFWFQGVEFWPNRIIADPLMLVLGYMIAKRYPQLVIPARIFSVVWLATHIFVFPHSMYLHYFF